MVLKHGFHRKPIRVLDRPIRVGEDDHEVVERVANRVLWLNNGVIMEDGDPATVLAAYRASSE